MDITLARTFLEIVETQSFQRAAQKLNVTQTSISARVRTLEQLLERRLFVRNKAGAALTRAGEQFLPHATMLVQVWERARHQVAVPVGSRAVLAAGCEISLWDPLLLRWLLQLRAADASLAIRTEVGFPHDLLDKVAAGVLDIAIAYAPQQRPGLRVELLIEEKLVMVTTAKHARIPQPADYVYVDWGPEFATQHDLAFPELSHAAVSAGLGPLGREFLLAAGGTGYFRLDVVRAHLESGHLRRVPDTPEFLYPAYAVYAVGADPKIVEPALAVLRQVASAGPGPIAARQP
ncbi:LysR family transcriptional regulator [Variovorax sp. J2P1-59]|uniref:LysR family transcriptional regulator n=1 Tax=Variovorax flavidus TaxID=3053501 RepID=UPI002578B103|nr:LysR family transcriptional regulator [Variovorax sp. J2P1-59]MDM0076011.1 LysR family transcriptional regulator [Variovorax sp. J2P1-59]